MAFDQSCTALSQAYGSSGHVWQDRVKSFAEDRNERSPIKLMITDRRPARDTLRREYDSSHCLEKIHAPACVNLAPLLGELEAARDAASPKLMKNVCTRFLASLSAFYGIASPNLKLLGPRPHSTHEGRLANELFGDYEIKAAKIRFWTRTPMKKQPPYQSKGFGHLTIRKFRTWKFTRSLPVKRVR